MWEEGSLLNYYTAQSLVYIKSKRLVLYAPEKTIANVCLSTSRIVVNPPMIMIPGEVVCYCFLT